MKTKAFLTSLTTQAGSAETQRAYRQDLERFEAFLKKKGLRVTQVKPSVITEFLKHLEEEAGRPLSPATVSRRLSVLSAYYDFLGGNSDGKIANPVLKVKRPKVRNDEPRAIDDNSLAKLVEAISDKRDRAIVLLFLYSGLRLSELRQLNTNTITTRRRTRPDGTIEFYGIGEVTGKGRKRRKFLVGPSALQALGEYIRESRTKDTSPALFLSERRTRLSTRAIQQIVDKWCRRSAVDQIHPHQLRHSFATRNVNAGMSAAVLQELMGHASLMTTQRYFRVRPDRLAREYNAAMEFVSQGSPI
jgi:site-specific recombinase XerD